MPAFYRYVEHIPVVDGYDILVLGGGIAGVGAAVSASRCGCKVLLIEKQCNAGGLATGGLISYFLPLCDGLGTVVSRGLAEELFHLAVKYGPSKISGNVNIHIPDIGKERLQSYFYPAVFQIALDTYLKENGVRVLYDSVADTPVMKGTHCDGVIINRREGRALYKASVFIDTTGDASVMRKAGSDYTEGRNMLSGWYYTLSAEGMYSLDMVGADAHEAYRSVYGGSREFYRGLTSEHISKYVTDVKEKIFEEEKGGLETGDRIIVSVPSVPQLRCHTRIIGIDEINADNGNRYCETSVGCVSDWREPGIVYEVPFGIMLSDKVDNIITAGRTVSAKGDAYEVLRCIPQCAVTGEAAGMAAALCCEKNIETISQIDIPELQERLGNTGVPVHYQFTSQVRSVLP